jgi:molybdopterin-guanine dinucleotide biosynthesis protein A
MTRALTGFVLTGGKSSRMGTDKASLHLLDGETLIEHALALLSSVASEVRLLGSREKYSGLAWAGPIVEDIFRDQGPLAGIHAALKSSDTDLNIVLAVDMPAMTSKCLEYIIGRAESSDALVTVPDIRGGQQPLCAVYRKEFCQIAEQALKDGRNKVNGAFTPQTTLVVRQEELEAAGFSASLFDNINTHEEWLNFKSVNHG